LANLFYQSLQVWIILRQQFLRRFNEITHTAAGKRTKQTYWEIYSRRETEWPEIMPD